MNPKDFPPRRPAAVIAIGANKPFDAPEEKDEAVKIPPPDGFDTSDMRPGATKDVVCSVALSEDGMLEIKSINGIPLGGEKGPSEEAKTSDTFANSVMPGADEGEGA